jgi:hypothetical protein
MIPQIRLSFTSGLSLDDISGRMAQKQAWDRVDFRLLHQSVELGDLRIGPSLFGRIL